MTCKKDYVVTKKIKIHTSPLVEVEVVQTGKFVKETPKSYVFDSFRVSKDTFVKADDVGGDTE
jgi:hypothetical protein